MDGRRWPSPFRRLRGQVLLHCSQGRLRARRAGLLSPAAACCGADPHHKLRLIDYCALLVSAVGWCLLMSAAMLFPVAVAVPQQAIQTSALLHAVAQACP